MVMDEHNIFHSDLIFAEIYFEMFTLDCSHTVHNFKFEVWKHGMQLRAMLDLAFQLFVTFYFQGGLIQFSVFKLEAVKYGAEFLIIDKEE